VGIWPLEKKAAQIRAAFLHLVAGQSVPFSSALSDRFFASCVSPFDQNRVGRMSRVGCDGLDQVIMVAQTLEISRLRAQVIGEQFQQGIGIGGGWAIGIQEGGWERNGLQRDPDVSDPRSLLAGRDFEQGFVTVAVWIRTIPFMELIGIVGNIGFID
jgi:hypothetical protein